MAITSSSHRSQVALIKGLICALMGAALNAWSQQPYSRSLDGPMSIHKAVYAPSSSTFDPFQEGPAPLKIILVASQGKGKPLFGLPHIWMSVHQNEYISHEMERGLYGPSWWFKMVGAVQRDKLLVDIGFNIGGVGIVAAAQGMQVIGFEPVRKNWILGQQSIRLNHLQTHVILHHAAVHWSGEKMRIMHNFTTESDGRANAGQGTLGSLSKDFEKKALASHMYEDIDTLKLSDAVKEDVWLMKLDVEGCECHCLKSGEDLFTMHNVNYVFIETDLQASNKCGCTAEFYLGFFKKHDFGFCNSFEGKGTDRTCTTFDDTVTASTWFSMHDRWLRHRKAAPLPGKPMV